MESSEEAYGWVDISCYGGGPSLFHLRAAFLRMCSQEDFLDLENEEYVVFYLGRTQALLLLPLFWGICPLGRNSSSSAWGPSLSCLTLIGQNGCFSEGPGFKPLTATLT